MGVSCFGKATVVSFYPATTERKDITEMKHLDKALIGAGAALLLSGGVAAAAIGPGNVGSAVVSALPGDVALAVSHGPLGGMGFVSTAATYIGISEADLRTQLQSGKSLADIAVANGKTRDGLVAALVKAATTDINTLVDKQNPFPAGGHGDRGEMRFFGGAGLQAASTYLGVSEADLRTQLQSGKTLADVAKATSGKTVDGLIQAIVNAETAQIDQAVKDGKLTAAQATTIKTNLTQRVTDMVNGTHPWGGPHR